VKISLFIPCLVDQFAPDSAKATVRILERLGHEVSYNTSQTCCGQAPFNAGFRSEAKKLAQRFINLFKDAEVIVAPSGSCVSMVKKHYAELDLGGEYFKQWEYLRDRIWELTSFLVDCLQLIDVGARFPHRVSYHASCHLLRDLGIGDQPLKLLRNVGEIELIEGNWKDECCGFGGVFSVKYRQLSQRIADRRAGQLASGNAEYITGADDSCLLNLGQAFRRIGAPQETLHVARILASEDGKIK
jgi:L-lactate dehydrogenase complex protein LldE